jgi:heat shock protein HtpX
MSAYYSGGQRSSKDNNAGALILIAAVLSMLVYIIFIMIVRAVSRTREFYADRHSAITTENPKSLQSALVKISTKQTPSKAEGMGLRAFFIADPVNSPQEVEQLRERGLLSDKQIAKTIEVGKQKNSFMSLNSLFSTHPPVYKRLENLAKIEKNLQAKR